MSFQYPFVLALAVPYLIAAVLLMRRQGFSSTMDRLTASLRAAVILIVIAALAGPTVPRSPQAQGVTALVDVSSSMTARQGEDLLKRAEALADALGSQISFVPFASSVGAAASSNLASFASLKREASSLGPTATNLEAALTSSSIASNNPVLLLSDGYETTGHVLQGLHSRVTAPVFPLTTQGPAEAQEVSISQLDAPTVVKNQKSTEIRATISNSLPEATEGILTIRHGPTEVLKRPLTVRGAKDLTATAQSDPALEGLQPITATFSWRDSSGSHSTTRTTWMTGEKRERVLVLSGTPEDDRFLSQLLKGQSYQVRSEVVSARSTDIGPPSDYMAIIFNNVPLSDLPKNFESELPQYVKSGGGLVMVGGNKSFGLGGYIGSRIEDLLPVRLVPPHVEKKRLNVAVQLVIDKSRSMAMDNRIEFAKAASREVLTSLKDDDYIGVIGFDDAPFIALPLSQVGAVRSTASDRISRLFPTKKTNLFPALDEARRGLSRIQAGRKHVIVLTDGKLPDPGPYYFDLIRQMRVLGVTVSTVVVGDDADDGFLAELANIGGGSFYQTRDPSNLPKIFLSDVKVASGEQTLKESESLEVRNGPDGIRSTKLSSFPDVKGFVETLPREPADTELLVTEAGKSFPLLASWSVNKGRAIAFTSDANGRWSAPWMRWDSINEFWSDLIESAMPKGDKARSNVDFELRTWVEGADAVLDLSLFQEVGDTQLTAMIKPPEGEPVPLAFEKLSPGHYQARLPQPLVGTYRARISMDSTQLPEVAFDVLPQEVGEHTRPSPNRALLEQIASMTGGKVDPAAADLAVSKETEPRSEPLTHLFSVIALMLFFAEILLREFGGRIFRGRAAGAGRPAL